MAEIPDFDGPDDAIQWVADHMARTERRFDRLEDALTAANDVLKLAIATLAAEGRLERGSWNRLVAEAAQRRETGEAQISAGLVQGQAFDRRPVIADAIRGYAIPSGQG